MTVTLNTRSFQEMESVISELEVLTSKPGNLSSKDSARNNFLLAKLSMLRQGVSVNELKAFEQDRLRAAAGLAPETPARIDHAANEAWRAFLGRGEIRSGCEAGKEFRDNIAGTQSIVDSNVTGAPFVPFGFHASFIQSLPIFDEITMPEFANQFDDASGGPQVAPAIDDLIGSPLTINKSTIVGEAGQSAQTDVVAASATFPTCPTLRSGRLFFSYELVQDSPLLSKSLETIINRRHSIGIGGYCITGTGSTGSPAQPQGLTTNLPSGTVTTSAASTLALSDFEAVYASISPAYIKGCAWYMNDSTRALVTKLLESSSRGMIGPVNELLRRPIAICNSMTPVTPGASAVCVLANTSYIYQRFIPNATGIRRYTQAPGYVEYGLIGIEGFTRFDQRCLLFGSAIPPVASLNVHS
jgi:HK97 family phage major capsid protein